MARYYNGTPDNPPTYVPHPTKTMWQRHLEGVDELVALEKQRARESAARQRRKGYLQVWARKRVYVEMRAGRLKRKPCFCGKAQSEAHHNDYKKPLKVIWLCKRHHVEADKRRRELDRVAIPTPNV